MEEPARPWMDRYRSLLEELNASEVSLKLKRIEAALWDGLPGRPSLFGEKLAEVRTRGEKHRRERGESPPDLLVLCVGYSPEPLLLAVAHHGPREVALLKTSELQKEYLDSLTKLWDQSRPVFDLPEFARLETRRVGDDPTSLFLAIQELVERRRGDKIVLDITGAKKSMIAGAFLAAGLLGIETSYVDFDDYDPVLRRPLPGTSKPGRLEHPYRKLMLREQGRLETEFDRGNFREAATLAEALGEMAQSLGREVTWFSKFTAIQRLATAYGYWKEGFYQEAAEALAAFPEAPSPPAVEILHPVWPRSDQPPGEIVQQLSQQKIFADPAVPLAYLVDVLAWSTETRIAEQPRDVYLRLYGTVESLVFFVFHTFVTRDSGRLQIDPPAEVREAIIDACERNSRQCLEILKGKKSPIGLRSVRWKGTVIWQEPALSPELVECLGGYRRFTDLRNQAVHWLAPVPQQQARDLLDYFRDVLQNLVPAVTARLRKSAGLDGATLQRMGDWERRLLSAAGGEVPEDCRPLTYREAERRIRP